MLFMATATAEKTLLPTPQDRPDADVLIYDGDCRFCTAGVQRIAGWDKKGRVSFLSLHDPEVYRRYPDLTHDYLMTTMVLVDRKGKRHAGAAAMRYLSRHLPRLWPLMPFLHIPFSLPVWQWLYRQVAKRRYKIAGKMSDCDNGACAIHFK
jgi:predicted DCC family thiol-disulfide oxidoreductase YuxK